MTKNNWNDSDDEEGGKSNDKSPILSKKSSDQLKTDSDMKDDDGDKDEDDDGSKPE